MEFETSLWTPALHHSIKADT